MKKRVFAMILACSMAAALLTACGGTDNQKDPDSSTAQDESVAPVGKEDTEKQADAADETEIVYSNDSVDLAQYIGIAGVKYVYTITDFDIKEMVEMTLSEYAEYKDLDRASQEGDILHVSMLGLTDGEEAFNFTYSENEDEDLSYEMVLGAGDFGKEVDEKLTGVKAGDKLAFAVEYPDDDEYFPGMTIDYTVEVLEVREEILPEYNDDFVKENLGYQSVKEYEAAQMEEMQAEQDQESMDNLYSDLLGTVVENSVLKNYDQDKYESMLANLKESYEYYAQMFGYEYEDMLAAFGMTEEDLTDEAMTQIKQDLVVAAIAEKEGIKLTDDQLMQSLEELKDSYGYESAEDMLGDFSKEELKEQVLTHVVQELIYQNAVITEEESELGEEETF